MDEDTTSEKSLLPVVAEGTFAPVRERMNALVSVHGSDAYLNEALGRMAKWNPYIAEILVEISHFPEYGKEHRDATLFAGCVVYDLLESQADADRMKAEMRDSPP